MNVSSSLGSTSSAGSNLNLDRVELKLEDKQMICKNIIKKTDRNKVIHIVALAILMALSIAATGIGIAFCVINPFLCGPLLTAISLIATVVIFKTVGVCFLFCSSNDYWLKDQISNDCISLTTKSMKELFQGEKGALYYDFENRLNDLRKFKLINDDQFSRLISLKKEYLKTLNDRTTLVHNHPTMDFKGDKPEVGSKFYEDYQALKNQLVDLEGQWKDIQDNICNNLEGIPELLQKDCSKSLDSDNKSA